MNRLFLFLVILAIGVGGCGGDKQWQKKVALKCNPEGAFRALSQSAVWKGSDWSPTGGAYPVVGLKETGNGEASTITVLTTGTGDSIALLWQGKGELSSRLDEELGKLQSLLSRPADVYGMEINQVMWKDSVLVVTELTTPAYPSVEELYKKIDSLRAFVAAHGVKETNPPMLNVVHTRLNYKSTIAIPVDKELEPAGDFAVQHFVPWKVMTGEVKGGIATAEQAMEQLRLYVLDYQLTAMAMPFQSLETERNKEIDTAKWVTRVVVPVP